MGDKMYYIQKRFPDKREAIALLMVEDPEFRTICEDYDDCVNACRYWDRSKTPEAETRGDEYRTLIKELEMEIIEAIEK